MKLKIPISAKYEDATTIPTLLSAQKGIKCCPTMPVEVRPQMKKVVAKIQKAGCFIPSAKLVNVMNKTLATLSVGG